MQWRSAFVASARIVVAAVPARCGRACIHVVSFHVIASPLWHDSASLLAFTFDPGPRFIPPAFPTSPTLTPLKSLLVPHAGQTYSQSTAGPARHARHYIPLVNTTTSTSFPDSTMARLPTMSPSSLARTSPKRARPLTSQSKTFGQSSPRLCSTHSPSVSP